MTIIEVLRDSMHSLEKTEQDVLSRFRQDSDCLANWVLFWTWYRDTTRNTNLSKCFAEGTEKHDLASDFHKRISQVCLSLKKLAENHDMNLGLHAEVIQPFFREFYTNAGDIPLAILRTNLDEDGISLNADWDAMQAEL